MPDTVSDQPRPSPEHREGVIARTSTRKKIRKVVRDALEQRHREQDEAAASVLRQQQKAMEHEGWTEEFRAEFFRDGQTDS